MIRRLAGVSATLIGAIGLALSIYAGIQTWSALTRINRATDQTLDRLQTLLEPVQRQSESAVTLISATRERFESIRTSVEGFSVTREPTQPTTTAIEDSLDQQVVRRLEAAEEFVRAMQTRMRDTSSALLLLDSVPFFSMRLNAGVDQRESQLQSLATGLTEISDLLDQVTLTLGEIRSQSVIRPGQLQQLQTILAQIDSRLQTFQTEVQYFSAGVDNVAAMLGQLRQTTPARLQRAAALVTVFFVCFGCSQISLLLHGWTLTKRRQDSVSDRSL